MYLFPPMLDFFGILCYNSSMLRRNATLSDARCVHSRKAVEKTAILFFSIHNRFKKITISGLCRDADVSTPTFYRHFQDIGDVIESCHQRITSELSFFLGKFSSLSTVLVSLFNFACKNKVYYLAMIKQMDSEPFNNMVKILERSIKQYMRTTTSKVLPPEKEKWLAYRIGMEIVMILRWWIVEDGCNTDLIEKYTKQIMKYVREIVLRESQGE